MCFPIHSCGPANDPPGAARTETARSPKIDRKIDLSLSKIGGAMLYIVRQVPAVIRARRGLTDFFVFSNTKYVSARSLEML